ncbi:hypothetical protein HY638_03760 [Candidatus Woesearchaeota archaeon]|nr:hypothetical protein [Candidatus Woesearchaeota archaeon]
MIAIIAQAVAYVIAIVVIIQIVRLIFGGSWEIENVILALVVLNITLTFGLVGYVMGISSKMFSVNTRLEKHIGWHKGLDEANRQE